MNPHEKEVVTAFLDAIKGAIEDSDEHGVLSMCKTLKNAINGGQWEGFVESMIDCRHESPTTK